jgi:hypothetical protein
VSWLALISGVISAIVAVIQYLKNQQALDTATAVALSKHLRGALDEIKLANDARAAVRDDAVRHPERVRDDSDGFRRD